MIFGSIIVASNILAQAGAAGARKAEAAQPNTSKIFGMQLRLSEIEAAISKMDYSRNSSVLTSIIEKKKYSSYKEMQEVRAELEVATAAERLIEEKHDLQIQLNSLRSAASEKMSGWAKVITTIWRDAPLHIAESAEPALKGLFVAGGAVLVPLVLSSLMFPPSCPAPPPETPARRRQSEVDIWAAMSLKDGGTLNTKDARDDYLAWCKANGRTAVKPQTFGSALKRICESRGCVPRRSGNLKWWEGVSL